MWLFATLLLLYSAFQCAVPTVVRSVDVASVPKVWNFTIPQPSHPAHSSVPDDQLRQSGKNVAPDHSNNSSSAAQFTSSHLWKNKLSSSNNNKKSYRILQPGTNLHVSNLLDDLEKLVTELRKKIYGTTILNKSDIGRNVQDNPSNRISSIIQSLKFTFPNSHYRHKRSIPDELINNTANANFSIHFPEDHSSGNTTEEQYQSPEENLFHWFKLGTDAASTFQDFLHRLSQHILQLNINQEYVNNLNKYLNLFTTHIGTEYQYDDVQRNESINMKHASHANQRKKRFSNDDSFEYDDYLKNNVLRGKHNYFDQDSSRMDYDYSEEYKESVPSDRHDDGYSSNSHHGYGSGNVNKFGLKNINPYVALPLLAACSFITAMMLSVYFMKNSEQVIALFNAEAVETTTMAGRQVFGNYQQSSISEVASTKQTTQMAPVFAYYEQNNI